MEFVQKKDYDDWIWKKESAMEEVYERAKQERKTPIKKETMNVEFIQGED